MTDLDLARRAVACKHWRWTDGMRATRDHLSTPRHAVRISQSCNIHQCPDSGGPWVKTDDNGQWKPERDLLPDLTDPATVGALLALVREAYKQPNAHACFALLGWVMRGNYAPLNFELKAADTEAAALVAALEAAP